MITREQQDRIAELAFNFGMAKMAGDHAAQDAEWIGLNRYLDSIIAEPEEQPYGPLATVAEVQAEEDARLHADDARAAMAALICEPRWEEGHRSVVGHIIGEMDFGSKVEGYAFAAHELADAMQAERNKRRQG